VARGDRRHRIANRARAALLKLDIFRDFSLALNELLLALVNATRAGTSFVFGYLDGAPLPFSTSRACPKIHSRRAAACS
jgi:hypothetical protein